MKKVYVVAAKRTAIGKFLGTLTGVNPADLAVPVVKQILNDTQINAENIDEVIVGNVLMAGHKQGIARQIAIKANIPQEVPAYGINMICGSGMKSIMQAYVDIIAEQAEVVLAGGTESMSVAGYVIPGTTMRNGSKMGDYQIIDHMVSDGLTDAFTGLHMGITAENIAEKYSITREEQDVFAHNSQKKAINAIENGNFRNEITPLIIPNKKGNIIFEVDEFPNKTSTPEKLAALRPAFKKDGTVTAGNASGINDGASFTLIASENAVNKYNLTPLVEIIAIGQGGVAPEVMGLGPVPAIQKALTMAKLNLTDIDTLELNEAFAAQALGVIKTLCENHKVSKEWINERTNKNGGAIALGHPIGASGNRIAVSLIHEMKRNKTKLGLASLCIGGGMGACTIYKNV